MRAIDNSNRSAASLVRLALVAGFAFVAAPAVAEPGEVGIWYDDTGKGAVKIEICTPTTLCGRIYWLKEPLNANGDPKTDKYNPEPSMRDRFICGLPVLGNLEQLSDGGFDNGWVYDPKVGKSYDVALDLVGPDQLKVTGYKGIRLLGKSFIWTRAPADLPPCTTDTAATPGRSDSKGQANAGGPAKKPAAKPAAAKLGASGVNSDSKAKKAAGAATTPQHPVASN